MSPSTVNRKFKSNLKKSIEKLDSVEVAYHTANGVSLIGDSSLVLEALTKGNLKNRVQLVFTSPPFPLNRKKKYNNLQGEEFRDWLAGYARLLRELLTPDGSIVLEMGNAWEPGEPVMSTLALETLLAFKKAANLHLCQEFIWHNPAKLPTPAQWVTIERIRVKDSFTRLWWLSPTTKPKADNKRVLVPYSESMRTLLRTGKYNAGLRPSEHVINDTSFLKDNGGAIPPNFFSIEHKDARNDEQAERGISNVLVGANTASKDGYHRYCSEQGLPPHPARMPPDLARFFIGLCTEEGDLVIDPFGGSNTTGAVANELGRRWIVIEANRHYAESGRGRFPSLVVP